MLLEAAAEEACEAAQAVNTEVRFAEMLTPQVSAGTWEPPATASARTRTRRWPQCCGARPRPRPCAAGLVSAVQLGGDIDTVAALVGGLMGGKLTAGQVRAELPWH
jgi:ADP-ribosyl-[dinitrogen reductase] hydrolase